MAKAKQPKSKAAAGQWLAGFIDGEGCVWFRVKCVAKKHMSAARVLTISNTEKELIDYAAACMDKLGILYRRGIRPGANANRKRVYTVEIRRGNSLLVVARQVPLQCSYKRKRLTDALSTFTHLRCKECKRPWDECTPGCYDCRKRHELRLRTRHGKPTITNLASTAPPETDSE